MLFLGGWSGSRCLRRCLELVPPCGAVPYLVGHTALVAMRRATATLGCEEHDGYGVGSSVARAQVGDIRLRTGVESASASSVVGLFLWG